MTAQTWNAAEYGKNARFVAELGAPVLELLAPQAGERILLENTERSNSSVL